MAEGKLVFTLKFFLSVFRTQFSGSETRKYMIPNCCMKLQLLQQIKSDAELTKRKMFVAKKTELIKL